MNDPELSETVSRRLRREDPTASGHLLVRQRGERAMVVGAVHSTLDLSAVLTDILAELIPGCRPLVSVTNLSETGLRVVEASDESRTHHVEGNQADRWPQLDRVSVLFQGEMPLSMIEASGRYKRRNHQTYRKVEAVMSVVGFTAPLVLDRNLRIIDGDLRYAIACEHLSELKFGDQTPSTVPCIVVDDDGTRSDFLRLVLNRSAEFQRWLYAEVDEYVDSTPQLQPLLEPLGFFGERILPESFFGNTVLNYEIYEGLGTQQDAYKQEYGLAKWSELQRQRVMEQEEARRRSRARKATEDTISLFDLAPTDDDFLPVYDIDGESAEQVSHLREIAHTITERYDEERRNSKAEGGQAWQGSRRSSKEVIAVLLGHEPKDEWE